MWSYVSQSYMISMYESEASVFPMLILLAVFEAASLLQGSAGPLMSTTKKQAVARW